MGREFRRWIENKHPRYLKEKSTEGGEDGYLLNSAIVR